MFISMMLEFIWIFYDDDDANLESYILKMTFQITHLL